MPPPSPPAGSAADQLGERAALRAARFSQRAHRVDHRLPSRTREMKMSAALLLALAVGASASPRLVDPDFMRKSELTDAELKIIYERLRPEYAGEDTLAAVNAAAATVESACKMEEHAACCQ